MGMLSAPMVYAGASVSVNVTGSIVTPTCTVDTTSTNQTVELGSPLKADLTTAGTGGDWKDFNLLLSNCSSIVTKVKTTFTGTVDPTNSTYFYNTGTAANVALQLADKTKAITLSHNSTLTVNVDTSHNATIELNARIYSYGSGVDVGTFKSAVTVAFEYQ